MKYGILTGLLVIVITIMDYTLNHHQFSIFDTVVLYILIRLYTEKILRS